MSQVQPIPGYSVRCHAHLLNLVVKKSLKEAELQELLFKVRKIVGHFRSSTSMTSKFEDAQRKDHNNSLQLIQEVQTRWNSTYMMIERVYNLRQYIEIVTLETQDKVLEEYQLSASEWKTLSQVMQALKSFFQATQTLEGDKYPTLSLVSLFFNAITRALQKLISFKTSRIARNLIGNLQTELTKRFDNTSTELRNMVAILDPRTKNDVEQKLWDRFPSWVQEIQGNVEEVEVHDDVEVREGEMNGDLFANIVRNKPHTPRLSLLEEVEMLKAMPLMELGVMIGGKYRYHNPCDWWRLNMGKLPILSSIARIVLLVCFAYI